MQYLKVHIVWSADGRQGPHLSVGCIRLGHDEQLCSRQPFYRWLHRIAENVLRRLRDRSPRRRHIPKATITEVSGKIIYVRKNYHFGPGTVAISLERYHDVNISKSGVWPLVVRRRYCR